jgi:hypothetical protein
MSLSPAIADGLSKVNQEHSTPAGTPPAGAAEDLQ